jgi:hypothetical protein
MWEARVLTEYAAKWSSFHHEHTGVHVINFHSYHFQPGHFKGIEKKIEMCGIYCHNNTKFLHATAEVCLNLMHKKWNSYEYLQPDTTTGNYVVKITTFLWHCTWNSIVTFTLSNSVLRDTLQDTALYKVKRQIFWSTLYELVVHFFTAFPVWRLLLSAHTQREHWDFPSSLVCVTGILSANVLVWPWAEFPYRTSEQSFDNFFVENFQWHFFLAWLSPSCLCIVVIQLEHRQ